MPIIVNVDVMLARRKMRLNTLAEKVGVTPQNLSVLKTGRAKAIRFSTLEALCAALECQPGDLLAFEPGQPGESPEQLPPSAESADV
jgi:putative transcriptional regulator